jgi:hypothetical protein
MSGMKITGGCHCGHISYEAEVDPGTVRVCHCADCQKLTGTAFRSNVANVPGTFALTGGAPTIYVKTAESGNKRCQAFCPECGTSLYSTAPEPNPEIYRLTLGGIDQRAALPAPGQQIWCRSALSWSTLNGVARAEKQQ